MQNQQKSTGTEPTPEASRGSSERPSPLKYVRLAADLRAQVERGVLRPGERFPSVRKLSRQRGVSISTVMQTFMLLERDGLVAARERSGYYVAARPAAYPQPRSSTSRVKPMRVDIADVVSDVLGRSEGARLVPLGISAPGPTLLPLRRLHRAVRSVLAMHPEQSARYGPLAGHPALTRQIARHGLALGCTLDPDDLVVTAGGLEALNLCLRAVARPGEIIAVESPTYFGVLQAAESLGVRVVDVPAEPGIGVRLDLLERALVRYRPAAVVCMPTVHNPLGCVMSRTAKADLVALITRRQVPLIEDDVYGDLAFGEARPPAAKSFDTAGLVLLVSSFSKTLAPGVRVGWIEAGRFGDRVRHLKAVTSMSTQVLGQLALARLLEDGFFERHLRRLRLRLAEQTARCAAAVAEAFPTGTRLTRPDGGCLIWVELPPGVDGTALYRHALQEGISTMPGELFSLGGKHRGFLRVSCGAPWSAEIENAIGTLGAVCRRLQR